jgi:DNA topoisomerase VI subunit A/intein/homing endonuclease
VSFEISKVDVEARKKAAKQIRDVFLKIIKDVEKGKPPTMVIPKRTLSNTVYDNVRKLLLLGEEKLRRELTNMGEAKKFMQTMLMASIIYRALVENEYPTIRDLYYRGKHTIKYIDYRGRLREEETWSEQKESDSVIRDIEVITGLLRENMLILSKEKGKVVGNMKIKSGDDIIDLSKMGHGAYAIESTPDLIEFKDVDAEYVLVVEKDAVFQQLHRIGYWKKHKALLVTSAGQPDRATRRFVRRLNEELKLPVYILTDSIPADEVVVAKDLRTGEILVGPVEELIGKYFTERAERERVIIPLEVPSWNPVNGKIEWTPVGYAYRHRIKDKIIQLRVKGRGTVRVTKAHSLFVFRNGEIIVEPAYKIKPGDYILVAEKLPILTDTNNYPVVNLARTITKNKEVYSKRFKLENTLWLGFNNGSEIRLSETGEEDLDKALYVRLSRSRIRIPNNIVIDEELAWILGLYTAEGSSSRGRYLTYNLGPHESEKAEKLRAIIREKLGVEPVVSKGKGIKVTVSSRLLYLLYNNLGLMGNARTKRIPSIILQSPTTVQAAYLKGLIDGDGSIDNYGNIVYSTRSTILSKQLFLVLQALGVNPSITINGEDIIIRIGKSPYRTPPNIYKYLTNNEPSKILPTEPTYGLPITNELKKRLISLANTGQTSYSTKSTTMSKAKLVTLLSRGEVTVSEGYRLILEGDATVARVVSVEEEEYNGYVYDFAVPMTNSFTGGYGVIYHNSDPYGWYIYSVFKIGSITLSYESERLATPPAKFLGVSMTDVFGEEPLENKKDVLAKVFGSKYKYVLEGKKPFLTPAERRNYIIKAKPQDLARAAELVGTKIARQFLGKPVKIKTSRGERSKEHSGYEWFKTPKWIKEIGIFFLTQAKLEIEAMASRGLKFLAFEYIPTKIETGDWID